MKFSGLIAATSNDNGVIAVRCLGIYKIRVLGCSTNSSTSMISDLQKDPQRVDEFSLTMKRGSTALLAVAVEDTSSKTKFYHTGFLTASWGQDQPKPYLDLDALWSPSPDRTGQIFDFDGTYCHTLAVEIDGMKYISSELMENKVEQYKGQTAYVHGDLLCKYLLGEVDAIHVKMASMRQRIEARSSKLLIEANAKIKKLEESLSAAHGGINLSKDKNDSLAAEINGLYAFIFRIKNEVEDNELWGFFSSKKAIRNKLIGLFNQREDSQKQ